MEEYENLKQIIESAADDVQKAQGGNKAAGTRVRKTMQDIKNTPPRMSVSGFWKCVPMHLSSRPVGPFAAIWICGILGALSPAALAVIR